MLFRSTTKTLLPLSKTNGALPPKPSTFLLPSSLESGGPRRGDAGQPHEVIFLFSSSVPLLPSLPLDFSFLSHCFRVFSTSSLRFWRAGGLRRRRVRIRRGTPNAIFGESLLLVPTSFSFAFCYFIGEADFGLRIWDQ